jgi:hypothetical protein
VAKQGRLFIQHEIDRRIEAIGGMAGRRYTLLRGDLDDGGVYGIRIDSQWRLPGETEDHGTIRSMADTGVGQRTVETYRQAINGDAGRPRPITIQNLIEKANRGSHRPHCMRARRPDADLEQVEDGKKQGALLAVRPAAGPCLYIVTWRGQH